MSKQTDVFYKKFQRFERWLRRFTGYGEKTHFGDCLEKAASQNIFIRKNFFLIEDLYALRNVFAHQGRKKYIANINNYALATLGKLVEVLKSPPTVISKFKVKVYEAKTTDFISSVMAIMLKPENTYTHVPVWNNKTFVGVFSYTSFFEWLAEKQNEGNSEITFGKKVMGDIDRKYLNSPCVNFRFIKQKTNLYEIPPTFERETQKRKRLDCLFITPNGVRGEEITGIITPWDLGRIK